MFILVHVNKIIMTYFGKIINLLIQLPVNVGYDCKSYMFKMHCVLVGS